MLHWHPGSFLLLLSGVLVDDRSTLVSIDTSLYSRLLFAFVYSPSSSHLGSKNVVYRLLSVNLPADGVSAFCIFMEMAAATTFVLAGDFAILAPILVLYLIKTN